MSLQWDANATYGNTEQVSNATGTVTTCSTDGDNFVKLGASGAIAAIKIPEETVITDSTKTITATLEFSSSTTFIDFASGVLYKSVSITLNYIGYRQYYPTGSNGLVDTSVLKNALIFGYGGVVGQATLANGKVIDIPYSTLTLINNAVSTAASGGAIGLLPSAEKNGAISPQSLMSTAVPDETVVVCFLAGTEIRTPEGVKNIEDIVVDDYVIIRQNNTDVYKKVIKVNATLINASINECTVICIKAHALDENVPYKDLYVTGEHCLYLDGHLIPARMLVNNSSIILDKSKISFYIYHIECEEHAIIYANGAFAETYLDTSHKTITNSNLIKLGTKTWEKDAAAPLGVKREIAEAVWKRIQTRSGSDFIGPQVTHDPDLHLTCKNNTVIRPHRINNGYYSFFIPSEIRNVWIKSNASRPSETVGPFVDDRRLLGVLINEISLFHETGIESVTAPFQENTLPGWYRTEGTQCCWTNGAAYLPLEHANSTRILCLHLASFGPYLAESDNSEEESTDISIPLSA